MRRCFLGLGITILCLWQVDSALARVTFVTDPEKQLERKRIKDEHLGRAHITLTNLRNARFEDKILLPQERERLKTLERELRAAIDHFEREYVEGVSSLKGELARNRLASATSELQELMDIFQKGQGDRQKAREEQAEDVATRIDKVNRLRRRVEKIEVKGLIENELRQLQTLAALAKTDEEDEQFNALYRESQRKVYDLEIKLGLRKEGQKYQQNSSPNPTPLIIHDK